MLDLLSKYTFGTPDFGHSDIWHFNFALKFLLSDTLKAGYFPLWSKDIGTGFPLLGEGQIGMFNLYNSLAFKFLNPVLAFNLGYLVIFLTVATGSFLFARTIKLSKTASLYLGMIFALSGVFVTQINHFNLIQSASFLPWEFFLTEKILSERAKKWPLLLSLVISQQIFSGFQQSTMISLFGLTLYFLVRLKQQKKYFRFLPYILSLIGGLILALPQILPSRQLVQLSFRSGGVSITEMTRFPFHPKNLLTFFNPYLWGDPRIGTYPTFTPDWGIFWESTGYLGIIPLLLIFLSFLQKKFSHLKKPFLLLTGVSLLLLLGKYTPFFFVFQIPPLSLFRVPARFLLLFVWSLSILAAIGLNRIRQPLLVIILFILSLADIGHFALTFNPVVSASKWLSPPTIVDFLKKDSSWFRIYSISPGDGWNNIFLKQGWANMNNYLSFRNALDPNQNLYWQIPSVNYYAGIEPRRTARFKELIDSGTIVNLKTNELSVSSESAKLLSLAGVKYLISPYPYQNNFQVALETVATISATPDFFLIKNNSAQAHTYLTNEFVIAESIEDLVHHLTDPNDHRVVLESPAELPARKDFSGKVEVRENSDLEVRLDTVSNSEGLLVLSDSYYPGWRATIDGKETRILPANLNQRAIILPAGEHEVVFKFEPYKSFN